MTESQRRIILSVEDIHVFYGAIHAIKGVSLEVREDEIVTLIGANGAGKSTTLNAITGLLKPRSGKIVYDDKLISGKKASKIVPMGLCLCPEGRRIFQQLTVRENLDMGGYPWTRCLSASPASRRGKSRSRERFPAASSRCWPWPGL